MKLKWICLAVMAGLILWMAQAGFCARLAGASEWVEKVGPGSVNWSAGYIEAIGIAAIPDKNMNKINARPAAFHDAKVAAQRNLLEITKSVRLDSETTIRELTTRNDVINVQVEGLMKTAQVVDQQYMLDGTVEVTLRLPLYGSLSRVVMPVFFEKRKSVMPPAPILPTSASTTTAAPPVVAQTVTVQPAVAEFSGLVVDARGIGACPAMGARLYDENGHEIYGSANVDRESAVEQGMSGYGRDLDAAKNNARVTANPMTVKALRTGGMGKSDLVVSNADAARIRAFAERFSYMKSCRVMIVLD